MNFEWKNPQIMTWIIQFPFSLLQGDSGGPLTYENVQLGVTSFGAERCEIYPFGYTDISPYLEWIYQMITSN